MSIINKYKLSLLLYVSLCILFLSFYWSNVPIGRNQVIRPVVHVVSIRLFQPT